MPSQKTITVSLADGNETVPVHARKLIQFTGKKQRITCRLEAKKKLEPGICRAAIYTKDAYLGSVEFEFRDSFRFF